MATLEKLVAEANRREQALTASEPAKRSKRIGDARNAARLREIAANLELCALYARGDDTRDGRQMFEALRNGAREFRHIAKIYE